MDTTYAVKNLCPFFRDVLPYASPRRRVGTRNEKRSQNQYKKIIFNFFLLAAFAGLVNCGAAFADQRTDPKKLPIIQQWSGDYPVSELVRLPENLRTSSVGYLADADTFGNVWQAFKPNEKTPDVEFKTNLVVFSRNTYFYNRTSIVMVKLADGVLDIVAMETMSALPIEAKAAMAMAVIPRAGVKFIRTGTSKIPVPEREGSKQ